MEFIIGAIGTAIVIDSVAKVTDHSWSESVKTCVDAYYSDKYNGVRHGDPNSTFVTCMSRNFPETFKRADKRFAPSAPAATTPQSQNVTTPTTQ